MRRPRASSACALRTLGDHPEFQQRLRDDHSLIAPFVEEMLRTEAPLKGSFKLAKVRDDRGRGRARRRDDGVRMTDAASRDPRHFDDPDEFRLDRPNGRQHLAFGTGIHSCAGAPLARAETHATIVRFLERMSDIRISEEHHGPPAARRYEYDPTYMLRGLRSSTSSSTRHALSTMRAAVYVPGADDLVVETVTPVPAADRDVIVRVTATGVCHSDQAVIDGKRSARSCSGTRRRGSSSGPAPRCPRVRPGDRIIASITPVCGTCWHCVRQETHLCDMNAEMLHRVRATRGDGSEANRSRASAASPTSSPSTRRRASPCTRSCPTNSSRSSGAGSRPASDRSEHRRGAPGCHRCRRRRRWRGHRDHPRRAGGRRGADHRRRSRRHEAHRRRVRRHRRRRLIRRFNLSPVPFRAGDGDVIMGPAETPVTMVPLIGSLTAALIAVLVGQWLGAWLVDAPVPVPFFLCLLAGLILRNAGSLVGLRLHGDRTDRVGLPVAVPGVDHDGA